MTEQQSNGPGSKIYQDLWYQSSDGLRLYARDYNSAQLGAQAPVILCMHGLTRNSADFTDICDLLADSCRLIVADQRGRGNSEYDPDPQNYNPMTYVQDMFVLLENLAINSVILMGTSMGGLMAMLMTASQPDLIRGLIINDVGPEVAPAGLARIKGYVGRTEAVDNWDQAIAHVRSINAVAFPKFTEQQWSRFTRFLYREDEQGRPYLAYDPAISASLDEDREPDQSAAPDLWPVFELIAAKPMLLIRGALSDILAPQCVQRMCTIKPDLTAVEIAEVGHAPMLNETRAVQAIKDFLQGLAQTA